MRGNPGKRDQNRYCNYHREHGHKTSECRILKIEIEKLIQRDYLKEFTGGKTHEVRPQGRCPSLPYYPPRGRKHSPTCHNPYRRPRSPYRPRTDKRVVERRESDNIVYDNGHKADEYDNGLIGRPILTTIKAIVPPIHLKLKFPMAGGIGEMSGDQNALACVTKHPFPQSTQVPEIRSQGTNGKVNLKSTR
ncbi:hypothetical protein LIER_37083 [Lithospermum erythrorhizon]|uniref:Uncharacterized protein n=1 Tax=Lithospermum erythrorhizon TaxID=34254 RepID=A0AAV3PGU9_LITER